MGKEWTVLLLCVAASWVPVHAETFVIEADKSGHDATLKIPVSAITQLSSNFAESWASSADPQVEAMRLSGDVLISIAGAAQPIHIKADSVVLELTPDASLEPLRHSRSDAAANKLLRSTATLPGGDDSQVFVGNVVFNLQTAAGPMEIKADRVEHRLQPNEPRSKAGA